MGQEINTARFEPRHFDQYLQRLAQETRLLGDMARGGQLSTRGAVGGCELEAWLIDHAFAPAPVNGPFIRIMNDPRVAPELALFNIEFNTRAHSLAGGALSAIERELRAMWARGVEVAAACDAGLLSIGILPTLHERHLTMDAVTPLNRYHALNEQVLRLREGRPLRLDVMGNQRLKGEHESMMLEAAGTSFQIHLQAPFQSIHRRYNAALAISAPMLAAGANSPYLFGLDLWDESRIALFEQSLEVGGYGGASQGPLRRVGLGSGYARRSIMECFQENLQHFPVLLPILFDDETKRFSHLRLHNGTVWRWNRPLVGFNEDGTPHVRIEHRVLPASPTIVDAVSDAALFYGLVEGLCAEIVDLEARLPFATVKDNFHRAARYGLRARLTWLDGAKSDVRELLLRVLLPLARRGLLASRLDANECAYYLGIIERRVEQNQNGASWQREYVRRHGRNVRSLTAAYAERQRTGDPVHTWPLQ